MDEMEVEFKKLLSECDIKLQGKQKEIDSLVVKIELVRENTNDRHVLKT